MLTRASLTIRLHPNDDVVIARAQLVGGTTLIDENVTVVGPRPARPQGRDARASRRRAGQALQPDHRLRQPRHRGRRARPPAQPRDARVRSRLRVRRRREAHAVSSPTPATFQGIVRADGRVATRNYIGILSTVNCSATVAARHRRRLHAAQRAGGVPQRRRRGRADARLRLRHGQQRREHDGAAAHARRLRAAPQLRRRAGGRPRLRVEPDQLAARRRAPAGGPAAAHVHHPGHRRHDARPSPGASR